MTHVIGPVKKSSAVVPVTKAAETAVPSPVATSKIGWAPRGPQRSDFNLWLGAMIPRTGALQLMGAGQLDRRIDALKQRGVAVKQIGASRAGRPMHALTVGHGPTKIAVMAAAHPDEPTGSVTAMLLAEKIATEPALAGLAAQATFHIVPGANPDGAVRNEAWFSKWTKRPDLGSYLTKVRRDLPADDVEFGFPAVEGDARPENLALASWLKSLGPLNHFVSLHSMFIGGGALFLVTGEADKNADKLGFLLDQARDVGLPLHDKDRFGQKGFHRIGPGLMTAPTREEMQDFFRAAGQDDVADRFRLNSMQFAARHNDCPLAIVSEIPLCYDPRLSSMAPMGHSRAEEELRFASTLEAVAVEAGGIADALEAACGPAEDVAAYRRSVAGIASAVSALKADTKRYGDAPATEGNVLENRLNELRRRATFVARALDVLGNSSQDLERKLKQQFDDIMSSIGTEFQLRHPTLETQVAMQLAAIVAPLATETSS